MNEDFEYCMRVVKSIDSYDQITSANNLITQFWLRHKNEPLTEELRNELDYIKTEYYQNFLICEKV